MQRTERDVCSLGNSISGDHDTIFCSGTFKADGAHGALEIVTAGIIARESGSELDVGGAWAGPVGSRHVGGDVPVGGTTTTTSFACDVASGVGGATESKVSILRGKSGR